MAQGQSGSLVSVRRMGGSEPQRRWICRHPGYRGGLAAASALPPRLGSLRALAPGPVMAVARVVRNYLEDQMLLKRLDGYPAYAAAVRYRLIPGIW